MRLDRINEVLNQKLDKYKHECSIQEDDREFLVRQLVAIKKENSRLRREIDKIKSVCSYVRAIIPCCSARPGREESGEGRKRKMMKIRTGRPNAVSSNLSF